MTTHDDPPASPVDSDELVRPPQRLNYAAHGGAQRAMLAFSATVEGLGLERSLLTLIKTRASQINGCAYCIDMHTIDAVADGESHQRLHALAAWRETPFFTARERAALALTEAITVLGGGVSDEVFDAAADEFSEAEMVALTWAAAMINTWNRVAITARATPGRHRAA